MRSSLINFHADPGEGSTASVVGGSLGCIVLIVFFTLADGPVVVSELFRPAYASTHGTVESVTFDAVTSYKGPFWRPRVAFTFSVEGTSRRGTSLSRSILDKDAYSRRTRQGAEQQFKIGNTVDVRYDPADPARCYVVVPGMKRQVLPRVMIAFLLLFTIAWVVAVARTIRLHLKQMKQTPP